MSSKNNTNIGTNGSIGTQGITSRSITQITGTSGLHGVIGSNGIQGTSGPAGSDWKQIIEDKYKNRFIIKTEYDAITLAPTTIIIDNNTGEEYKFKPLSMYNIMNETENFINELIITLRDLKINNIINENK